MKKLIVFFVMLSICFSFTGVITIKTVILKMSLIPRLQSYCMKQKTSMVILYHKLFTMTLPASIG